VEGSDEWVQGPRVATSCKHKVKGLPSGEKVKFRSVSLSRGGRLGRGDPTGRFS